MNWLLILLFILWYGFWGIYNFWLLSRKISTEKSPRLMTLIYRLLSVACLPQFGLYLSFIFWGILIAEYYVKNIELSRLANSIFQMTWLFSVLNILNFGIAASGLVFGLSHLPAFLVKHLNFLSKTIIVVTAMAGGFLIAGIFTTFDFPFNLGLSILIHWTFYYLLRPVDRKMKLKIIN